MDLYKLFSFTRDVVNKILLASAISIQQWYYALHHPNFVLFSSLIPPILPLITSSNSDRWSLPWFFQKTPKGEGASLNCFSNDIRLDQDDINSLASLVALLHFHSINYRSQLEKGTKKFLDEWFSSLFRVYALAVGSKQRTDMRKWCAVQTRGEMYSNEFGLQHVFHFRQDWWRSAGNAWQYVFW